MSMFLALPLEIRYRIYDLFIREDLYGHSRGVMVVSESHVREELPLMRYRSLLVVCRQIYQEFQQAFQHMAAANQMRYRIDVIFTHGRPFFDIRWRAFPALSQTLHHLRVNIDLHVREPFEGDSRMMPDDHELLPLLQDTPRSFAVQAFNYTAVLLKTLANLMARGDPHFGVLYIESITINVRRPTTPALREGGVVDWSGQRVFISREDTAVIHDMMSVTLESTSRRFEPFDAAQCDQLTPLIQIGSLQFAINDCVWGEEYDLVLVNDKFHWLRY